MVTSEKFREVMGNFATGITVVTTRAKDGQVHGLTANAFTSVSLDPLLILVCFDNRFSGLDQFRAAGKFAVSFLSESQEDMSRLFAKGGTERPESLYFAGPAGQPVLRNSLAYLECETSDVFPGGDHQIVVGRVVSGDTIEARNGVKPILYFRGKYQRIS